MSLASQASVRQALLGDVGSQPRPDIVMATDRSAAIAAVLGRIATSRSLPKSCRPDASAQAGLTTGFSGAPDGEGARFPSSLIQKVGYDLDVDDGPWGLEKYSDD